MSAEILEFKKPDGEKDEHLSGPAKCRNCGHEWVAVAPIGNFFLECPECSVHRGMFKYPVQRDGFQWQCKCRNELFRITPDGIYCPMCGEWQEGYNAE